MENQPLKGPGRLGGFDWDSQQPLVDWGNSTGGGGGGGAWPDKVQKPPQTSRKCQNGPWNFKKLQKIAQSSENCKKNTDKLRKL